MLSLIRTILAPSRQQFTLVYGVAPWPRSRSSKPWKSPKNRYMNRLRLVHVLSDEPGDRTAQRPLDDERCAELLHLVPAAGIDRAFVCGPAHDGCGRALAAGRGVAREAHKERWDWPPPPDRSVRRHAPRRLVLIVDGKERRLRVPMQAPQFWTPACTRA
jgi:ring-1,2-phenylacetyl-CoA epoxidase subunit PaaE